MDFLARVVVNALAVWLSTLVLGAHLQIVGSTDAAGTGTPTTDMLNQVIVVLAVGLLFALVNAIVKPVVTVLALPLYILTLGLFGLVINGLMVLLVDWLTRYTHWGVEVDGFWWAVLAGLLIGLLNSVLSVVVRDH